MAHPAETFVEEHIRKIAPMVQALNEATWDLNVTGDEQCAKRRAELDATVTKVYANEAEFLRVKLFSLGARYPWDETLKLVTGERFTPRYFAEQFVGHGPPMTHRVSELDGRGRVPVQR